LAGNVGRQGKHPYLYFEYREQIAVRKGRWKYFSSNDEKDLFRDLDVRSGTGKWDKYFCKSKEVSLFDLQSDRHEDRDIKEENKNLLEELKECIVREHCKYQTFNAPSNYEPSK
jgi:arylsulfatase A-like enzyme